MTKQTPDRQKHKDAPWRNFYGRRHGKKLRQHQADLLNTRLIELAPPGVDWDENPERNHIDLRSAYPDAREFWLEIGFGGGEHAIAQAAGNPDVQIIGAEPYINGVAKLLAAIERAGVSNLAVTDADARDVMDVLPDGSIAQTFLLYPDPWPKTRHHKRRFMNPAQLDMLARVMAPGARLRVATDIEDYVRHSLQVIDQDPRFTWAAERPVDWRMPWPGWHRTRYEAKALREGRTPHYLTFVRQ